jgi:hypothetical protein
MSTATESVPGLTKRISVRGPNRYIARRREDRHTEDISKERFNKLIGIPGADLFVEPGTPEIRDVSCAEARELLKNPKATLLEGGYYDVRVGSYGIPEYSAWMAPRYAPPRGMDPEAVEVITVMIDGLSLAGNVKLPKGFRFRAKIGDVAGSVG